MGIDFHFVNIGCPRCQASMEWAATTDETPHIVDYHCDCSWKGDYNHLTNEYDEYSDDDYGRDDCDNKDEKDV